jgi:hypothetical protein
LGLGGVLLLTLAPLASYTSAERVAAGCLAIIAAGGVCAVWIRGDEQGRALTAAAVVTGLVVFAAPSQAAGGTLVTARLVYFPLFLVLLAMTTVAWPAAWSTGVIVAAVTLSGIATASRWAIYERYDTRMREFLELAERLPPPDRVYFGVVGDPTTLRLDDRGTPNVPASAWGYVAAGHAGWLLSDYEPLVSYFPLVYRTSLLRGALARGCGEVSLPALQERSSSADQTPIVIWMRADRPELQSCLQSAPGVWKTVRGSDGLVVAWWPSSSDGSVRRDGVRPSQ